MDHLGDRTREVVPATIEREMRLIQDAIALVASGGAPRAAVFGLRLGDQLLDPARRIALQAGVCAVPLWRADEAGIDIAIEQIVE